MMLWHGSRKSRTIFGGRPRRERLLDGRTCPGKRVQAQRTKETARALGHGHHALSCAEFRVGVQPPGAKRHATPAVSVSRRFFSGRTGVFRLRVTRRRLLRLHARADYALERFKTPGLSED